MDNVVLVKFTVPAEKKLTWVNPKVHNTTQKDMHHVNVAKELGYEELTERGRHREGRIDTGENREEHNLTSEDVHQVLRDKGLKVVDVHCFEKVKKRVGKPDRKDWTLCLVYSDDPNQETFNLKGWQVQELKKLQNLNWAHVHIWCNPNGVTTLNFLGGNTQKSKKRFVPNELGMFSVVDVFNQTVEL